MKRILNTVLISAVSVLLFSCIKEEAVQEPMNETIVLDISSSATKADFKEDNATESFVSNIDVLIFEDNSGTPGAMVNYDRYVVNNASSLTLNARRSSFAAGEGYHVYLVANSNLPASDFAAVEAYDDFVEMKQTDRNLHLTGLVNVANAQALIVWWFLITEMLPTTLFFLLLFAVLPQRS